MKLLKWELLVFDWITRGASESYYELVAIKGLGKT